MLTSTKQQQKYLVLNIILNYLLKKTKITIDWIKCINIYKDI